VAGYRGKRAFDLAVVVLTSPFWVPLLAVIAVMVRSRIGKPVLFRQPRVGLNDRTFTLVKFRTMTTAKGPGGIDLPDEQRFTRFGNWLRSTSLDELPELLNVLRGDMSLVGPRPLLVRYLPRYSPRHRRRHSVRPGLTGLAQVGGRNALSWPARLDMDVDYVERASLSLDLSILARTITAVFSRKGVTAETGSTMSEFMGY
jgi:lipopolysaccharide/colanic/teichoic acid biosynthesis glycosyltransferase